MLSATRRRVLPASLLVSGALAAGILSSTIPAQASVVAPTTTVAATSVVVTSATAAVTTAATAATTVTTAVAAPAAVTPAHPPERPPARAEYNVNTTEIERNYNGTLTECRQSIALVSRYLLRSSSR